MEILLQAGALPEEAGRGVDREDLAHRLHAVLLGHHDVGDHDRGPVLAEEADALAAIGRLERTR